MKPLSRLLPIFLILYAGLAWGTVESVVYINDLNATYPASGDARSEGDDHIRNLKTGIKATFPNVTGAVTPTHTELNYVDGVTSAIQTQIDSKIGAASLGLTLIETRTVSGSTTVDFTTGIDSTYDEYELHIINFVPANAGGATIWLRTSADAGATWNATAGDYDWTLSWAVGTAATITNGGANPTRIELSDNVRSQAAEGGFSAVVRIMDPAGTASNKRIQWTGSGASASGTGKVAIASGAATRAATAAINGIRIMPSTGSITSLKVKLYGVRKS